MPCVNLANIRAYRSSLKAEKKLNRKAISKKVKKQKPEKIKLIATAESQPSVREKRSTPIRRMQFGVPLMTHEEKKQAASAHRAARRARRAERRRLKAAAKLQRQFSQPAPKLKPRYRSASRPATKQPATSSEVATESSSDEPILLQDGDVIKIDHPKKSFLVATLQSEMAAVEPGSATQPNSAPQSEPVAQPTTATTPVEPATRATQHVVYVPSLRRHPSRDELINAESRIGSQIFGPIPAGHRREFFHHQRGVWIWYEKWTDQQRHRQELTVRYEVRLTGIYKKVAAGKYFKLEGAELENFRQAARTYLKLIKGNLYQNVG